MKIRTAMPTGVDLNLLAAGYEDMAVAKGVSDLAEWQIKEQFGLLEYESAPAATVPRSHKVKRTRPSAGVARESGAMKGLSVVILGGVVLVNAVLIGFAVSGAF